MNDEPIKQQLDTYPPIRSFEGNTMRLITDEQHAQIVEVLASLSLFIDIYDGEALDARLARRETKEALATLRALPEVEVEVAGWHPTEAAITALKRFEETCTDNEGYDVPKDTMRNLQAIGLIYRTYGDMYCITDYGQHILATKEPS